MKRPVHSYWGLAEVALFSAIFFTGLWFFGPRIGSSPVLQLIFWILFLFGGYYILWYSPVKLHHFSFEETGFFFPWQKEKFQIALKEGWASYSVFTIAGSAILISYTALFNPQILSGLNWSAVLIKFFGYLVYGTIQAIIFFGFIMPRIRQVFSKTDTQTESNKVKYAVIFIVALIFSLYHIPNPELMAITFAAGLVWAWIFYRRPNIFLMGLSHAILGTVLHQVVKMHMRIGPFYNNPDLYIIREVVPGLKKLIGDLF
jgi:membrane protease YdiL (CAAX protease family)